MSYCTMGTCLAHRLGVYFNLQRKLWVHSSGWPCEAMRDVPAPAKWDDY